MSELGRGVIAHLAQNAVDDVDTSEEEKFPAARRGSPR
jgi:hypothetical protein